MERIEIGNDYNSGSIEVNVYTNFGGGEDSFSPSRSRRLFFSERPIGNPPIFLLSRQDRLEPAGISETYDYATNLKEAREKIVIYAWEYTNRFREMLIDTRGLSADDAQILAYYQQTKLEQIASAKKQ